MHNITGEHRAILDEIVSHPDVQSAKKKVDEALKPVEKYWDDGRIRDKYAAMAGYYSAYGYGKNTTKDRKDYAWFYMSEDGDQGSTSSINFYLLDNGYDLNKVKNDVIQADNNYHNVLNEVISSKTGEYGKKEAKTPYGTKTNLNDSIAESIGYHTYSLGNDKVSQSWKIGDVGSNGKSSDNAMKKFARETYPKLLEEDYNNDTKGIDDEEILELISLEYELYGRNKKKSNK